MFKMSLDVYLCLLSRADRDLKKMTTLPTDASGGMDPLNFWPLEMKLFSADESIRALKVKLGESRIWCEFFSGIVLVGCSD